MIDIHCHLLPGIDDGAVDLDDALAMARIAVDDGITHAVVTPHIHPGRWENAAQGIASAARDFSARLREHGIPLIIGHAAEVRLTDQLFQQLEEESIPFLGEVDGYQVMLLEFPHNQVLPGSEKLTAWLLRNGIRPLLAHPERNKEIMVAPGRLKPFIDQGCMIQVTAGALVGRFGARAMEAARYFLANGQVDLIASDGHNTKARRPELSEAAAYITEKYGEAEAQKLARETPWRLVGAQFQANTK
ncbi:MAG: CpsB/CapC family capsule biosynthesis tyrosine phosphatase [Porticoccaceae bacterium]